MPVILAAFADHEFPAGVGGYSLFNSLTAVGALPGAILSARRTGDRCGSGCWSACSAALGGVLMLASLIARPSGCSASCWWLRAAHPARS